MENAGNQKLKLLKITKKIHTFYFCQLFALRPLPMRSNLPEVYPKDTMVASHQFEVITLFFSAARHTGKTCITKRQNQLYQLYNLCGPEQNGNAGPLFKNY